MNMYIATEVSLKCKKLKQSYIILNYGSLRFLSVSPISRPLLTFFILLSIQKH